VLEVRAQEQRAEEVFREAIGKAAKMLARSLELRAACDLAAMFIKQKRESTAATLLGPIYERFSEGHGTKDMRRAAALLEAANITPQSPTR
jgi:predicted ATPase